MVGPTCTTGEGMSAFYIPPGGRPLNHIIDEMIVGQIIDDVAS